MKRTPIVIALVAAVAAGAWYLRPSAPAKPDEPAIQRPSAEPGVLRFPTAAPQLSQLKVERAELAPVPMDEPLAARVSYDENATARLFAPVAGRAVDIRANVGDSVKAGAVLAVLDAPELGTAAADLAKARADAQFKKAALDRVKSLFAAEVVPRREFEAAQADWQQAQAEAERARLRLANLAPGGGADPGSQRYVLRAPLAGVVAARNINPAMEVRPDASEPLFVVTDMSRLSVLVDVPERDLSVVTVGKTARVEVSAYPERSFEGKVIRVAPTLDPQTRRIQARVAVDNREGRLRPGMFARVSFDGPGRDALMVPTTALLQGNVSTRVFVDKGRTDKGARFEPRDVQVGVQQDDKVEIRSGLAAGERIVVNGGVLLQ